MKKQSAKLHKESHVSPTRKGMGDHYGPAIKNKVGRIRDESLDVSRKTKSIGKPPKSLA